MQVRIHLECEVRFTNTHLKVDHETMCFLVRFEKHIDMFSSQSNSHIDSSTTKIIKKINITAGEKSSSKTFK